MPRHIKFGMIFLLLLSILGISYYYNLQRRIRGLVETPREPSQPYLAAKPLFAESAPLRKVKVFYPSSRRDGLLEPEEREIHSSNQPALEAKQIVAELISGSNSERLPALPPETKLRELFVTPSGAGRGGYHEGGKPYSSRRLDSRAGFDLRRSEFSDTECRKHRPGADPD